MTLAGTRPPTVDEWDKYELHHRARLATKPGLTGMWQVSGRSNITDLVISNLMLTGVQTGQIAVAQTINAMFSTLYATVFQPFQPQLLKVYASGNVKNFTNELEKTMKICGMFSNIAFAGFTSLGMLYYKLWLPAQDTKTLYWLTFIAVSLSITAGIYMT